MDTSETYIKMCDCKEIQELCQWDMEKDFFWLIPIPDKNFPLVKTVWLPRQDQLQEMVSEYPAHWVAFLNWSERDYPIKVYDGQERQPLPFWHFQSMEQLWLAFVMKEKFGKLWDSDNWV